MKQLLIDIIKILSAKPDQYFSRMDIENALERVSKRAILNEIKKLLESKRILRVGQSSSTAYKISNAYYEDFENILYIYQNQRVIGYLGYDYRNYFFAYDTYYLLSSRYISKFQMPLSFETYTQESCFVDFEGSLPEGVDRTILIDKTGNATEFFLLANNDYNHNDLIFSEELLTFGALEKSIFPMKLVYGDNISNESYLLQKEKILGKNQFPNLLTYQVDIDDTSLFPELYLNNSQQTRQIRTMSLSGFQHKLPVVIDDNTLKVAKDKENAVFFIKPYSKEKADRDSEYYFPHIAINEHLHMSFAKNELDFDVPMSGIFKRQEDEEYHYLIKYFDRIGSYKFQSTEMASFMGLNSQNKYNPSSEKLFNTIAQKLPLLFDRLRMLEYYFYSFVIQHEDMHTKNLSIIYDNGKNISAPLYDIATTGIYLGMYNYESHLTINGKQNNIRYKDFLEIVKKAEVSPNDFRQKASIILKVYIEKMPNYISKVSQLENIDFYIKERPNAHNKKQKIKEKTTLIEVMMKNYTNRCKILKENGWYEKLGIA